MWVWMKMEKISWADMLMDNKILQRVQENRNILDLVEH